MYRADSPALDTFNIAVASPITSLEISAIPLPMQEGLLGDELIPPQHLRFHDYSVLVFPLWPFRPRDELKQDYMSHLQKHLEEQRQAPTIVNEMSWVRGINLKTILRASRDYPGGRGARAEVENSLRSLPMQSPIPRRVTRVEPVHLNNTDVPPEPVPAATNKPSQPIVEPSPSLKGSAAPETPHTEETPVVEAPKPPREQSLRLFVAKGLVALSVYPPINAPELTSWLWPDWHKAPAEVRQGLDGSEFHVYQQNGLELTEPDNPLAVFARKFQEAVAEDYGELELEPEIHQITDMETLLLPNTDYQASIAA